MERKDIKTLVRLIKKERKVGKLLRQALLSGDVEKVPELSAKHRELIGEIHELLPPAIEPLHSRGLRHGDLA